MSAWPEQDVLDRYPSVIDEHRRTVLAPGWPPPGAFCVDWEIPVPSSDGP